MRSRRHSLRARIVFTVIGSVIATSAIFGLAAFVIAYTMEDRLFQRALTGEIAHQQAAWVRTGALAAPDNAAVTVHRNAASLPPDISKQFAEDPLRNEFYGRQGRHYHVRRFDLNDGQSGAGSVPAVAVIEVSKDLLVRPYRDSIIVVLIGMSLLIATIMAGLAWWLVYRAMKPLSSLAQDVTNADNGIPDLDAKRYPANEIGALADALEQAFARIRGFVHREQAFSRDASHELRTPLAVVRGAAEVIALTRDLPLHLMEPLRRIETATVDMTLALDQLLALARENKGVTKEYAALRPLIDKAVAWSKVRHPGSAITVSIDVDGKAEVLVHPTSLQLVLNNLIGNCYQHVGTGQLVVAFENGCLTITDDGPGFAPGADLFEPFAKGNASLGSGLGLDISRRLSDAAGFSLTADISQGGPGARFYLKF